MSTKDTDRGYLKLLKEINLLRKKPSIKVGLIGPNKHKNTKAVTMVKMGTAHEFGSKNQNIPQRSFMRTTFDQRKRSWFLKTKKLKSMVLSGKTTVSRSLDTLGITLETDIKSKIQKEDPKWPSLSPQTIKRKRGSTKKLIDTGQLKNSIRYIKVMNK
ncbi:MAG: hypothetical protein HRT90_07570 [Candidatus Margulisbacteria bacterium]|nr:hypothetical protein [Candidatus Margulisiibacteriota bacterium]